MDELLSEFLTETNESLSVLDVELVKLEQNPNNPDLLSNIFRLMHTIKGTCGFLGLPRLEAVAHAGENVLGKVRDGELEVTPGAVSLILECLDQIRNLIIALELTEAEPEGEDADLIGRLNAFAEGGGSEAPVETPIETSVETASEEPPIEAGIVETPAEPVAAAPEPEVADPAPAAEPAPKPAAKPAVQEAAAETVTQESSVANQSIRVNVELLENLMTTVSELVLTRNQLLQILRSQKESEFAAPLQRLNHVVSELQEGVMKTRMQPIGNAWAKLPRIIRDLSLELDKKIDLVMKGADTELDRQVLELIKDPLTHMVRNSADHGLEMPAERTAAGKQETGTILLNAFHEGGHIIIEISDDGKGLPVDKIKAKVIENGVATEAEMSGLSDNQIMQYIFKAGFSTAEKVTAVSGRGVGMDVVRTNIEKIGGTVELTSALGRGTRFMIKIPLTLAIVSALVVECGGERFAIPQISVVELVRASAKSEHTIEKIKDTPVLRLRDRLLPLVSLREMLKLPARVEPDVAVRDVGTDAEITESGMLDGFIVVTQVGAYSFGIIVDRVFDTEEIVVKPVAPILRNIALYSGNTILGDGSVVMILDPNGIATSTGEIQVADRSVENEADHRSGRGEDRVALLVFRAAGEAAPKAVPLSLVARLEEVALDKVELSNGQKVVQYRGHLMPLVQMDGSEPLGKEGRQAVLVFSDRGRTMGLVVDEIVDIVEETMSVELVSDRDGYLGSAVVGGHATDVIDAGYFLTRAFSDWFGGHASKATPEGLGRRVLLVDDSPFFRSLLAPLLSVAGYDVTTAESAARALELRELGQDYDVIISDIEMPEMDGFQFAETVKQSDRWSNTPIVALSSHTSPDKLTRGRDAGFDDYVAKSDREALLRALQDTIFQTTRGAA